MLADAGLTDLALIGNQPRTRARSPKASELTTALRGGGFDALRVGDAVVVSGAAPDTVGDLAAAYGIPLHELVMERDSLEDVYRALTEPELEYRNAP